MLTLFLIALSLSFDSFATSVGLSCKDDKHRLATAFKISAIFAIFQTAMPIFGFLIGSGLERLISHIDHWIAFFLLLGVGVRFIQEAYKENKIIHAKNWKILALLGLATSIDAFVIGITFAFIDISLAHALLIIFFTTLGISFFGYECGRRICLLKSRKIEIIGGVILIAIGTKILLTHLFF
ncbi:MAG TPA: hypothetical protein DCS29_00165 [Candidatus Magasanikbacteria bacterium]|nr:MAG: hypothetical protein A2479_02265 [Candidatus Magasanikbacteria bacterium RIFOXYC2_FULL_39_8]HAT03179.1 hypothetical protein [Candidatus Magasanikbacteria bacterium]